MPESHGESTSSTQPSGKGDGAAAVVSDLLVILRRELTNCWREPRSFFLVIWLPVLLMPLFLVVGFISDGLLTQYRAPQIYIRPSDNPSLEHMIHDALDRSTTLKIVNSVDPSRDLSLGKVDAIIDIPEEGKKVSIQTSPGSTVRHKLEEAFEDARKRSLNAQLKAIDTPESFLDVFKTVQSISEHSSEVIKSFLVLVVILALHRGCIAAPFVCTCALIEEVEKKTLETTILLPINRLCLLAGKGVSMLVLCLSSAVITLISLLGSCVVFAVIAIIHRPFGSYIATSSGEGVVSMPEVPWAGILLTPLICVLYTALSIGVCMVTAACSANHRISRTIITLAFTPLSLLPFVGMMPLKAVSPGIFVPFFNLLCILRASLFDDNFWGQTAIVLAEDTLLLVGLLYLASKLWSREQFVAKAGPIFALPKLSRGSSQ